MPSDSTTNAAGNPLEKLSEKPAEKKPLRERFSFKGFSLSWLGQSIDKTLLASLILNAILIAALTAVVTTGILTRSSADFPGDGERVSRTVKRDSLVTVDSVRVPPQVLVADIESASVEKVSPEKTSREKVNPSVPTGEKSSIHKAALAQPLPFTRYETPIEDEYLKGIITSEIGDNQLLLSQSLSYELKRPLTIEKTVINTETITEQYVKKEWILLVGTGLTRDDRKLSVPVGIELITKKDRSYTYEYNPMLQSHSLSVRVPIFRF